MVIFEPEFLINFRRARGKKPHKTCIKQVTVYNRVFAKPLFTGIIKDLAKCAFKIYVPVFLCGFFIAFKAKRFKQPVCHINLIGILQKLCFKPISNKFFYTFINIHSTVLTYYIPFHICIAKGKRNLLNIIILYTLTLPLSIKCKKIKKCLTKTEKYNIILSI